MAYCPKCGNLVDETMAFCPRCGAPVKGEPSVKAAPSPQRREKAEKGEKQEKQEKEEPEKSEKQEKSEFGVAGWLIGGLILILIGLFAVLQLLGYLPQGTGLAFILLIVGALVIIAAIYFISKAQRQNPTPS
jgi:uncharacterized membrane protein YvbJ